MIEYGIRVLALHKIIKYLVMEGITFPYRFIPHNRNLMEIELVLIIVLILTGAYTQTEKLTCNNVSSDKPKIYPIHSSHSGENEMPAEIINETISQNSSIVKWSKLVYSQCKVNVAFICNASYPIEWVEHSEKNSVQLMDTSNWISKDLWVDRIIDESMLEHSTELNYTDNFIHAPAYNSYTAFLGINYGEHSICAAANYVCQSVSHSCLQTSVLSEVDPESKTIKYKHYSNPYDHTEMSFQNDTTCEVILEVSVVKEYGAIGWKCKKSRKNQQTFIKSRTCDAAMHCNSYFRFYEKRCVRRLPIDEECGSGTCWFQNKSTGYLRHAGFVQCENEEEKVLATAHYFFSIPQSMDKREMPELYLDWDEADPQKMLYLQPLPKEIFYGETKVVVCKVSRYYFSFGHRFGFQFSNGTVRYSASDDGVHDLNQNANNMIITVNFTDDTLKRIYCFAPVWNSTLWVNQSVEVRIIHGGVSPSFLENRYLSFSEEKVTFDLHQRNATLSCKAYGMPLPKVKWKIAHTSQAKLIKVEFDFEEGNQNLVFRYVTDSIQGKYICEATNFLGTATKVYVVSVRDKLSDFIWISSIVAAISLLTFMVLLGSSCLKVRQQRNQIRALTDAEISEFRTGNLEMFENNEVLDTQELLQALPYNDEFEIPSKCLYVDSSEVLGSGNFGHVLKGAILDRRNMRTCRVVAVKTTKARCDVSYFQTLLTELKIMAFLGKHKNLVSLVGACTKNIKNRKIFIAIEFCPKGSLEKFLKNSRPFFQNMVCDDSIYNTTSFCNLRENHTYENVDVPIEISTIHLLKWAREIANGMEFLGSKKIIHGDLAARNVLLTNELIAKIGDFGLSRVLMKYSNYIRSTPDDCLLPWAWLAPETLQDLKFSVSSDVWSYGVTLWEIFSLAQHPYPGIAFNSGFIDWLKRGHRLHKPFCANSQIYNIMMDCWSLEPSQRATFADLKDFFEGLLQTCNGDYVQTKYIGNTQDLHRSHNLRVENPGYAVLGNERSYFSTDADDDSDTHTCETSVHFSTASEDFQGYLRPLVASVKDNEMR